MMHCGISGSNVLEVFYYNKLYITQQKALICKNIQLISI